MTVIRRFFPHPWMRVLMGATLLAVCAGAVTALQVLGKKEERGIPTARVQRGNLDLTVYTRGELRPLRTSQMIAPPVRGQLQITYLAKTGQQVKKDDVVIEFDPSEQEYNIEQARSELMQAEQEITKARADAIVLESQDQVGLLSARFAVRNAELDVSRNELVSAIDAKKNDLALEETKRKLAQLEQDIKSRQVTAKAGIAVLEQKRNRQRIQLERAETDLKTLKVLAPFDGLVSIKDNMDASGGFFTSGMVLPEYRQGDLVFPGRTIADVLDTSQMEVQAKVSEVDRSRIQPGQKVDVQVDARPGQRFNGKVKAVAGQAARGFFFEGGGSDRKFDVTFVLDTKEIPMRPGVSCQVQILGEEVKNALLLPRQAVFEKDGKSVVYIR
ncbi:MAG: efflux RND transporter periplasmic adaptor subunit, partial [Acidobacteria bacterium]|nr:efflux RND transporter periplasmic adaptor subunit [Acidobacteriota bacterium]